jgi:DNA-directed RNA polymerase specialized sigma24 family protein
MHKYLSALDEDWRRIATGPTARRALACWSTTYPALTFNNLDDLLQRRLDPETAPQILQPLAALSPSDEIAARTLLQALLPGLVRFASAVQRENPNAIHDIVALAWERIRTYPTSRKGSVPANVILDVRKRYWKHCSTERPTADIGDDDRLASCLAASCEDEVVARLTASDALKAGAAMLRPATLRLVAATRLGALTLTEIAADEGTSIHALGVRRHRAERVLRDLANR